MLQIIRDVLKHDDDKTEMSLLYANQVMLISQMLNCVHLTSFCLCVISGMCNITNVKLCTSYIFLLVCHQWNVQQHKCKIVYILHLSAGVSLMECVTTLILTARI